MKLSIGSRPPPRASAVFSISFWCIVGVQVAALLAMIGFNETILRTGTEVVLQTVPVDPRSIFQGDYVILRYSIGEPRNMVLSEPADPGTPVYVSLAKGDDVWTAYDWSFSREEGGPVVIRGVIDDDGWLDFGIGTYFVPEGTGRAIERAQDVKVRAVVNGDGDAVIKEVIVDGRPFVPGQEVSQ